MDPNDPKSKVSRRRFLKIGIAGAVSGSTMALLESLAPPDRLALAAVPSNVSDMQYNIGGFIAPVVNRSGIPFQFGPVYTRFATFRLTRTPTRTDQTMLADALNTIENNFDFRPSGLFAHIAYGLPYFNRLPQTLVQQNMPLVQFKWFPVLQEAIPSPTDVHSSNPGIHKLRFNVAVRIENNDVLITFRSDIVGNTDNALAWLRGSNTLNGRSILSPSGFNSLFTLTSSRLMFVREGLPRQLADQNNLPFRVRVNPQSPMWMGFADQHTNGSGPADIVSFKGNNSARHTTAQPGSYFDNGTIQHLSHVIQDLEQFYIPEVEPGEDDDGVFLERVQYMFRSTPPPHRGFADQFTNGGGPAFLPNEFKGLDDASNSARGIGTDLDSETGLTERRMGHLSTLQRSSRAPDGTPMHIRVDGPGFDTIDVPNGSNQPKLHFSVFVPSADFFAEMRRNQASLDFQHAFAVDEEENGLERFLTATRRQNYLMPPRRHRAFPLRELF